MDLERPMNRGRNLFGDIMAAFVAALGMFNLGTWWLDTWQLTTFGPDYIPMAPSTAMVFVVLGLTILLLRRTQTSDRNRVLVLRTSVGLTGLVAAGVLIQAWTGWNLPRAPWLTVEAVDRVNAIPVGVMSPLTAVTFLLAGLALAIQNSRWHRSDPAVGLANIAAMAGWLIGLVVMIGYATGSPLGYGDETVPMAWLTAAGFLALFTNLLVTGRIYPPLTDWLRASLDNDLTGPTPDFARKLAAGTAIMVLLITLAGFFHIRSQQTQARQQAYKELESIASLKAEQISLWRQERLSEATFLMNTPAVARDIADLVARPDDPGASAAVRGWLAGIKGGDRYAKVMVFDQSGKRLIALPETADVDEPILQHALRQSPQNRAVQEVDLHESARDGHIHFSLVVPIARDIGFAEAGPVAQIVLQLDPATHLYPLIASWPVPTATAEAFIVRPEGDRVVFLSPLRFFQEPPLSLRRPAGDLVLPAARAVRGDLGVAAGRDYRGERVLSTSGKISHSSWFLIVKVDEAEAFGPIRHRVLTTGALFVVLILVVVMGAVLLWREHSVGMLRRVLRAEMSRNELTQRLALLMHQANDIILILDENWRIVEANARALETYGYSLAELQALPPGGLRPLEQRASYPEQMGRVISPDGARFETVQMRKDGTRMPVEVSGRMIEVDGRKHVLAIYRDLTELKAHEAEREHLVRLYAIFSQVNQAIVHAADRDSLLQEICRVVVEYGRFHLAWIGWADFASGVVEPVASHGDTAGYLRNIKVRCDDTPEGNGPTGRALRENTTQVCPDLLEEAHSAPWREAIQMAGVQASISLPIRLGGSVCAVLSVYAAETGIFRRKEIELLEEAAMDIGFGLANLQREEQRAQIETELRASELRFRTLFDRAPVGISLTTSGDIQLVNAEHVRITGVSVKDSTQPGIFGRVSHPEDYARQQELADKFHRGEVGSYTVEKRYLHPDGRVQWAELTSHFYIDPKSQQRVIITILTDIAERKEAEERMERQLDELKRWHEITLGREERVLKLKGEVNALLAQRGQPPRYPSAADDPETGAP